jgi:predicted nuclease of predicted toxin-antitoxin system
MKPLLDTCVGSGARSYLEACGHDVVVTVDWPEDPGDEAILAFAHSQRRVLVTLDKDFGELAILRGLPHSGIIRLVRFRGRDLAPVCQMILEGHSDELQRGALITAEPGQVRIRSGIVSP